MKTKFKIQYILAFLLTVIVFNLSNSYALTNKDVLKVSEISDTKFLCLYYVNGTKLAQTRNDGSLVFYDINKKLDTFKKKRDNNRVKYLSATGLKSRRSYYSKYIKFKKVFKQVKQCKNYKTGKIACEIFEANNLKYKILNGVKCNNLSESVVGKILININNENEGMCSGILIAPNVFLSAAHCFDDGDKIKSVKVSFAGKKYNATKWYVNPAYNGDSEKGDISLIYIKEVAPYSPFKLVSKNYKPSKNEISVMIGHGIANFNPYIVGFYGGFATISKTTQSGIYIAYSSKFGESNTCNGDSGGPLAVYEDGSWRLFGTTSYGDDDYCGYYSKAENSWWSRINSKENIEFLEDHIPGIFD